MSVQFMLAGKDNAVVWRGPRKTNLIKTFLKDVFWGRQDFLIIDTPPGFFFFFCVFNVVFIIFLLIVMCLCVKTKQQQSKITPTNKTTTKQTKPQNK
jgi:hypothetical protein